MKYIVLLLTLLGCAACTYPFDASANFKDKIVVMQGDILIGSYTYVNLGYMVGLNASEAEISITPKGHAWIEDENGGKYQALEDGSASSFCIDTRYADPSQKYRLRAEIDSKSYSSQWVEPSPAPILDSISYVHNDEDVIVRISLHAEDGSQYFRWSYREDWKYHADYIPQYYYKISSDEVIPQADHSMYWCWNTSESSEVDLCATTDLSEDRIIDKKFLVIPRTSRKLSERYTIEVTARTLDQEAYKYLENLKMTSNYTGSLFSPNPSDIRGNIYCDDNPDEYVLGHICAGIVKTSRIYIDKNEGLYKNAHTPEELFYPVTGEEPGVEDGQPLWWFYKQGYVPVKFGMDTVNGFSGVLWGSKRCIDCRLEGGKTTKPEWWED